jgi:hypothetical protein
VVASVERFSVAYPPHSFERDAQVTGESFEREPRRDDRRIRAGVQERLENLLRPARNQLRMPVPQAVALGFVLTNHSTWRTLTEEIGMSPAKATAMTVDALETAIFGPADVSQT